MLNGMIFVIYNECDKMINNDNNINIINNFMATNPPNDGSRKGAIKERSQFENPKTGHWTKRDKETGRFMDVKTSDDKPFKGVRKEK